MRPVLLFKSGEQTPEGDPVLIHFGPGVTIEPHPQAAKTKTIVICHGVKHSVKGCFEDVLKLAGYEDAESMKELIESRKKREEAAKPKEVPTTKPTPLSAPASLDDDDITPEPQNKSPNNRR